MLELDATNSKNVSAYYTQDVWGFFAGERVRIS